MILLTAIVACLFLLVIALCLNSVAGSASAHSCGLSRDTLDNAIWAQEACLQGSATATVGYSWDRRYEAVSAFRSAAAPALAGMKKDLQRRGVACAFAYNDTAARAYVRDRSDVESIAGIIVAREGGNVKIIGCGYDIMLTDGSARYAATRLEIW